MFGSMMIVQANAGIKLSYFLFRRCPIPTCSCESRSTKLHEKCDVPRSGSEEYYILLHAHTDVKQIKLSVEATNIKTVTQLK